MGRPIRQETLTGSGAHKLVRQSKHNAIAAKLNERNVRSRASTGGPLTRLKIQRPRLKKSRGRFSPTGA
jgi:hypothetical protein